MTAPHKPFTAQYLRQVGQLDRDDVKYQRPNLKGEAEENFFFNRKAWSKLSDERFNALRQSFLLASKMLKVGNEYSATFLKPYTSVDIDGVVGGDPESGSEDSYEHAWISLVNPTKANMMQAWIELGQVSRCVVFDEKDSLWEREARLSAVIHGSVDDYGDPGRVDMNGLINAAPEEILCNDELQLEQRRTRSHLTVLITSDLVDTILRAREQKDIPTELRTVFIAAVAIVNSIGQVMFMQDFHNRWNMLTGQPSVNDEVGKNLGDAFVGFIFGGWLPSPTEVWDEGKKTKNVGSALQWRRVKRKTGGRPWFNTFYSISTAWVEKVLTQETWDAVDEANTRPYAKKWLLLIRQDVLYPPAPFEKHDCARGWTDTKFIGGIPIPRTDIQVALGHFPYLDPDWKSDIVKLEVPAMAEDMSDNDWQPNDDGIQNLKGVGIDIHIHDQRPGKRRCGKRVVHILRNQKIAGDIRHQPTVLNLKKTLQDRGIGTRVENMVLTHCEESPQNSILHDQDTLKSLNSSGNVDWQRLHLYQHDKVETLQGLYSKATPEEPRKENVEGNKKLRYMVEEVNTRLTKLIQQLTQYRGLKSDISPARKALLTVLQDLEECSIELAEIAKSSDQANGTKEAASQKAMTLGTEQDKNGTAETKTDDNSKKSPVKRKDKNGGDDTWASPKKRTKKGTE